MKKIFSTGLISLLLLACFMTVLEISSVGAVSNGIVGLWHFDEKSGSTAIDDSGYGNDGAIFGATYVSPGLFGPSDLHFDGDDDYIEVANEADFDFEYDDAFTLGAWIQTGSGDVRWIIGKIDASTIPWRQGFLLSKSDLDKGNYIVFQIRHDIANRIVVHGSTSISDGDWHYVFVTYDGSSLADGVQIYVDGKPESMNIIVDTLSGSILNDNPLKISGGGPVSWKGEIDEVRISYAEYHDEDWSVTNSVTLAVDHIFAENVRTIILEDSITLDLNGHRIIGKGPLYPDSSSSLNFMYIGVFIQGRTDVTVTDTRGGGGIGNFNRGIGLWSSQNTEIIGIDIHDNIDGIYFWFSSGNTVDSNYIHDNERHGIKIFGMPEALACLNQIINNDLAANQNGVFLQGGYANENSIMGNLIHDNMNGIRMQNSAITSPDGYEDIGAPSNNLIEENDIQNNNIGIEIEVSPVTGTPRDVTDNSISFNNIYGNVLYGIRTDAITDARHNWWGSSRGPTVETGRVMKGDKVSLLVLFAPWLRNQI